jgi:hypothetical protein
MVKLNNKKENHFFLKADILKDLKVQVFPALSKDALRLLSFSKKSLSILVRILTVIKQLFCHLPRKEIEAQ